MGFFNRRRKAEAQRQERWLAEERERAERAEKLRTRPKSTMVLPTPTKPNSGMMIPQHLLDRANAARLRALHTASRSPDSQILPRIPPEDPLQPVEEIVDDLQDLLSELNDDPAT